MSTSLAFVQVSRFCNDGSVLLAVDSICFMFRPSISATVFELSNLHPIQSQNDNSNNDDSMSDNQASDVTTNDVETMEETTHEMTLSMSTEDDSLNSSATMVNMNTDAGALLGASVPLSNHLQYMTTRKGSLYVKMGACTLTCGF